LALFGCCVPVKSETKAVKKGRPPRKENRQVIWLTISTLRLWIEKRKVFGLKKKSNSEFAEVLHGVMLKTTSSEEKRYGFQRKPVAWPSVSPIPLKSRISLFTCQLLF